jgi:excisionase family DNA binding protein
MPKSPHLSSGNIEPVLLSIPETAQFLNVGRSTVYVLVSNGNLEAVKIGARSLIKRRSAQNLVKRLPVARVNLSPRGLRPTAKK